MPIFEYECNKCGVKFEEIILADETPTCPKCKSTDVYKLVSRFRFCGRVEADPYTAALEFHDQHFDEEGNRRLSSEKAIFGEKGEYGFGLGVGRDGPAESTGGCAGCSGGDCSSCGSH